MWYSEIAGCVERFVCGGVAHVKQSTLNLTGPSSASTPRRATSGHTFLVIDPSNNSYSSIHSFIHASHLYIYIYIYLFIYLYIYINNYNSGCIFFIILTSYFWSRPSVEVRKRKRKRKRRRWRRRRRRRRRRRKRKKRRMRRNVDVITHPPMAGGVGKKVGVFCLLRRLHPVFVLLIPLPLLLLPLREGRAYLCQVSVCSR